MSDFDNLTPASGLAATVVTLFEMKKPEDEIRDSAMRIWDAVDHDLGLFRQAAAEVAKLAQPRPESAETTARMEPIRDKLGVTSAHETLEAALAGREFLERLDREHNGN
jgi:hypothetical protein